MPTPRIPLPPPDREHGMPLTAALARRRSVRAFAPRALTGAELGLLLSSAQGETDSRKACARPHRPVRSIPLSSTRRRNRGCSAISSSRTRANRSPAMTCAPTSPPPRSASGGLHGHRACSCSPPLPVARRARTATASSATRTWKQGTWHRTHCLPPPRSGWPRIRSVRSTTCASRRCCVWGVARCRCASFRPGRVDELHPGGLTRGSRLKAPT